MILLDTHAWVWWAANPDNLSTCARRTIEDEDVLGVSAISLWEVAMLVKKGRLRVDRDALLWLKQALTRPRVTLVPLSPEIAAASMALQEPFHGDPADRIIVATAIESRCALATKDERIVRWSHVRTIW